MFDNYGVRVPSMIISPLIPQGTVDHTVYDHTSVLATLERLYGMPPLTDRDRLANDLQHLLSEATPRTDCPTTLNNPAPAPAMAKGAAAVRADTGDQPLPEGGNVHAFLRVLLKTDLELTRGDDEEVSAIKERFLGIATQADAEAYAAEVLLKSKAAQANRATTPPPRLSSTQTSR
jgi:phospholipase C